MLPAINKITCSAKTAKALEVNLVPGNYQNSRRDVYRAFALNELQMPQYNLPAIKCGENRKKIIHKVIEWLNVEESPRFLANGNRTYCNIYAYDVTWCLGAYLPRVWWNNEAVSKIKKKQIVTAKYGVTVFEMNCNALANWFQQYGTNFGWKRIFDLTKMQELVNKGTIGIIVGQRTIQSEAGHITVVVPETELLQAHRVDQKVVSALQSQAGACNKKYFTGDTWWNNTDKFRKFSFWVLKTT